MLAAILAVFFAILFVLKVREDSESIWCSVFGVAAMVLTTAAMGIYLG
jgi:hypothetical protein